MNRRHGRAVLALIIAERSFTFVEAAASEKHRPRRCGQLVLPEGVSLETPAEAGQALGDYLRENGFTARQVVVGAPARWMIASEKPIPPADETQARALLRLAAERLSTADSGELIFDFIGRPIRGESSAVLLVGMPRIWLNRVEEMIAAAGLRLSALTSTALALAADEPPSSGPALLLGPDAGELVWREEGRPRLLRHLPMALADGGDAELDGLAAQLKRAVMLSRPGLQQANGQSLTLWNQAGLSGEQISVLSSRVGLGIEDSRRNERETKDSTGVDEAIFIPAAALARAAVSGRLALDFAHSRLAPPRQRRWGKRSIWAAALAVAAILAVVSFYIGIEQRRAELDRLRAQLTAMAPDLKAAQAVVDRVNYARTFFQTRPPALEGLRDVTLSFGDGERVWATGFTFRQTGQAGLTGKAADQRTILGVLDRLKKSPRFDQVKLLDMRDAGGGSRDVAFSISFTYSAE